MNNTQNESPFYRIIIAAEHKSLSSDVEAFLLLPDASYISIHEVPGYKWRKHKNASIFVFDPEKKHTLNSTFRYASCMDEISYCYSGKLYFRIFLPRRFMRLIHGATRQRISLEAYLTKLLQEEIKVFISTNYSSKMSAEKYLMSGLRSKLITYGIWVDEIKIDILTVNQ